MPRRLRVRLALTSMLLHASALSAVLAGCVAAHSQALTVVPVNVFLKPAQRLASLTVNNAGTTETSIQIRAFSWSQNGEEDPLKPTDMLLISPPIATISAGATQVVRIALREPPRGQEATYRLLIDQIPPAGESGVVHVLLRFSLPVFVETDAHATSNLQFTVEHEKDGKLFLVASNTGQLHDSIHDVKLSANDGMKFKISSGVLPYVLPGTRRRWLLTAEAPLKILPSNMKLTAKTDSRQIERQVQVNEVP